ncbi:sensor domain-containing diguanylate cyclase [Stutzerimonas marianensis]|uniref:sensor domain-containing diguanylate cyclase n=1 Tax=Stutzerimonas marianensis TaxID=2929513 RepID=UPI003C2E5442
MNRGLTVTMHIRLLTLRCLMALLAVLLGSSAMAAGPDILSKDGLTLHAGSIEWVAGHRDAAFPAAATENWAWQPLGKPNLGKQFEGAWLRFALDGRALPDASTWYLSLKWPVFDEVRVRLFYPDRGTWGPLMRAGDHLPMAVRPVESHNLVFPLTVVPDEPVVVYMQLQARELMALPMTLLDEAAFAADKVADVAMISLFLGGMLVILLYNCSLFVFTRDTAYLFYVVYLLCALFYILAMTGFGQLFLWPETPPITRRFYALSAALSLFTPLLFASRFLGTRRYGGWPWQVTWGLMIYWAVVILTLLAAPDLARYLAIEPMVLVHCVLTMAAVINLWLRGNGSARLFTIAWATLLLATIAHLLALEGVLPLTPLTLHGQLIGMFTEFVLLSIALAERINHERERRISAQQSALRASQALAFERESRLQAQQEALALQIRNNEALEARVYERTRALEDAKRGLEQVNAQLARVSVTDALTQLHNRGHFDLMLDEEIRRAIRTEVPLSVLLLDIDHFKRINDTYGHPFGDQCLRQVAETLRQHGQRAGDVVARYGGEEFAMILPALGPQEAVEQAERIRAAVQRLQPVHGETRLTLSISIGVTTLESLPDCTPAQLLAAADAALYRAKHSGRNQVACAPITAMPSIAGIRV